MAISGGCLCGRLRYRLKEVPAMAVNCHCSMCRKHSGAAFLSYAVVPNADLRLEGEGLVAFRSSPEALRSNCGTCGCPLTFTFDADPDHTWITIGSFDNPSLIAPAENWFVQDKVDWVMIDPALRNFPGGPPT